MKKIILTAVTIALMSMQCSDKIAGTNDETVTGTACLYMPDGKQAAIGATITLYKAGDTSRTPRYLTQTDTKGNYQINKLPDGVYNILAGKDTLVAYQDSIFVIQGKGSFRTDTLENQGTLSGWIKVQPSDDPRNVIVNVTGTNLWTNVNPDGKFTLGKMASGKYTIALIPMQPAMSGYVITFYSATARGGVQDTIRNALEVTYTGIPVVNGLSGSYDTLNGIMKLHWSKPVPSYKQFREYVIYRGEVSAGQTTGFREYAIATDTFFIDTQEFLNENEPTHKYEYMVAIRNKLLETGVKYESIVIESVNPLSVRQLFWDKEKIAYLNVPCTLSAKASEPVFGDSITYEWDIGNSGIFHKSKADTVITNTTFDDNLLCICRITSKNGRHCQDTISLHTGISWEKVSEPFDKNIGYSMKSIEHNNRLFIFTANGIWVSSDRVIWEKLSTSFPGRLGNNDVTFYNDKMITIDTLGRLISSTDGKIWDTIATEKKFPKGIHMLFPFKNDLYIFEPDSNSIYTDLIKSSDLTHWSSIESDCFNGTSGRLMFKTDSSMICFFNDGGGTYSVKKTYDLQTSRVKNLMYSDPEMDLYRNSSGVLYKDYYILIGSKMSYSLDGMNNWRMLAGNSPIKGNSIYLNNVTVFKDHIFIINGDGVFRSR